MLVLAGTWPDASDPPTLMSATDRRWGSGEAVCVAVVPHWALVCPAPRA